MDNQLKKLKKERKDYFIKMSVAWIFFVIVCLQCFYMHYPLTLAIMGIIVITPLFSHCLLLSTQIDLLDNKNMKNDRKNLKEEICLAIVSSIPIGLIYGYLFVESIYRPFIIPISLTVVPILIAVFNHLLILNTLIKMYDAENEESNEKQIVNVPS